MEGLPFFRGNLRLEVIRNSSSSLLNGHSYETFVRSIPRFADLKSFQTKRHLSTAAIKVWRAVRAIGLNTFNRRPSDTLVLKSEFMTFLEGLRSM